MKRTVTAFVLVGYISHAGAVSQSDAGPRCASPAVRIPNSERALHVAHDGGWRPGSEHSCRVALRCDPAIKLFSHDAHVNE
jgi:hypothetical protein